MASRHSQSFHLVDTDGDGATSLGDYPVFHDILLRNGEEVGDEGGTCPIVDVEQGLIHCTGTIRLAEGQLTFQGLTTTAATKHIAITGGTGRYQGVSGVEAQAWNRPMPNVTTPTASRIAAR